VTSLRRALLALGAVGFVAGVVPLILALGSDYEESPGLIAVFGPLIGWAFIGTGLFAWWRRPENRFGPLMTAVGFSWCVGGLSAANSPGVFIVGFALGALPYAFLLHMLMAFPGGRLEGRLARGLTAGAYFLTTGFQVALVLTFDTTQDECGCPRNPLLAVDGQTLGNVLIAVQAVAGIVILAGLVVVLLRRWRAAGPTQRRVLSPVYGGGMLVALFASGSLLADITPIPDGVELWIDAAGLTALAFIPFGFLIGLMRSRFTRAGAVSELVARLSEREERRRGLRDALADALGDPDLTLAYWLPDRREFVNAAGQRCELPLAGSGRVATVIEAAGEPLAAIVHDASLEDERELVRAVGGAATLTLENERLDAELRAKVEELRESRERMIRAALAERRRLERDLHDGAQQRLVSVALALRLARQKLERKPPEAATMLDSAAEELEAALEELRELARGIHPAVLSDRGLDAALAALARRAPIPVELEDTPGERLPEAVELATYFVVAEALTNVAKYSSATHASVRAVRDNGHVIVEVTDDGIGGANPEKGTGLRGLADRLSALDGRLEVEEARGGGTLVRADIPCG
jgi:signal transduction histidine kinase